jgi:hypothetical protein
MSWLDDDRDLVPLALDEFRNMTARQIFDLDIPRLLVSELGPFGTRLGVVIPIEDWYQVQSFMRDTMERLSMMSAHFEELAQLGKQLAEGSAKSEEKAGRSE